MTTSIEVAAYGWQGAVWDGLYPDDIPEDWRLDYYANEFFAVVVPYAEWQGEEDETLLEWQEQVSDDFRFYWELPEGEKIGESWELADLPEDKSVIANGELAGRTLASVSGEFPKEVMGEEGFCVEFPLLIKLLDC